MRTGWLVCILLSALAIVAACGGEGSEGAKATSVIEQEPTGEERDIVIKGSNFTFDQEEYHVATGEAVRIIYQNEEGNHAISVKRTNISLRHNEQTVVSFTEPGSYEIICSVYCGAGHANMTAKLIVE